jgi:hypothetical protein
MLADHGQIRSIRVRIHEEYRPRYTFREGPRGWNSWRELHLARDWRRHAVWRLLVIPLSEMLMTRAD